MPDHYSMKDKEKKRRSRTEKTLGTLGEGMGTSVKPKKKPRKKVPKVSKSEKMGVGRDMAAQNRTRLMKDLDNRIAAARAASNMDLVNKYMARKKALADLKYD